MIIGRNGVVRQAEQGLELDHIYLKQLGRRRGACFAGR